MSRWLLPMGVVVVVAALGWLVGAHLRPAGGPAPSPPITDTHDIAAEGVPSRPAAIFGWGDLPDQYGRRWVGDDGSSRPPPNPKGRDLPPILPEWRAFT